MKRLAYSAFIAFWSMTATIWLLDVLSGDPPPALPDAERSITLAEVGRHDTPESCWMAIDGIVYDFTDYLPQHPTRPEVMNRWCGKEASEAYHTKALRRPRPHAPSTDSLLPQYRIGILTK